MFITFEGLDFCGKSTQVKLLEKYLRTKLQKSGELADKKKEIITIREPGGTQISEQIRAILLDKINDSMKSETELLLFAASRAQLVQEVILPALEKGYYVISDRFHDSSIAYQSFGRNIPLDFVMQLQKFVIGNAIPDITFFIDIPVDEVLKRMSKVKNVELDRIESCQQNTDKSVIKKTDFYEKVRNGYLYLSNNEKRIKKIDGLLPIEDIHKLIINYIENIK